MISLPQYPLCRDCDLAESTPRHRVGMGARVAETGYNGKKKAVYLLAKAPASDEMETGVPLSGVTGIHANNTYIRGAGLQDLADCFLGNVVRCKLPHAKMAVPEPSIRACRGKWLHDVELMDKEYDEVVILCLGAEAVTAVLGNGVALSQFRQGMKVELAGKTRTVFATYMPTVLLPGNDPAKITAIADHLCLLKDYLIHGRILSHITVEQKDIDLTSRVPEGLPLICVDLETYGKIDRYPKQRVFHPRKMARWDGIDLQRDLVVTAGIAWRDPATQDLRHRVYVITDPRHREEFIEDMLKMARPDAWLLGQNFAFDVLCMREIDPRLADMLEPFGKRTPKIIELMVLNFLDSDQRPERSLKTVARLLSILEYDEKDANKKEYRRHSSEWDPELHVYQIQDVYATLFAKEVFLRNFKYKFGEKTNKGNEFCLNWYSDLAWLAISMSIQGIKYDVGKLREAYDLHEHLLSSWEDVFIDRWGEVLRRTGAGPRAAKLLKAIDIVKMQEKSPCKTEKGNAKRLEKLTSILVEFPPHVKLTTPEPTIEGRFFEMIQKYGLGGDKRLTRSDIKGTVANTGNKELLLGYATGDDRAWLRAYSKFEDYAKIMGTYLAPALGMKEGDDSLDDQLVEGFTYPSWRIVPSMDETGETGGTQQGRITPKGRAVQTDPPLVEDCEISRYPGGAIIRVDSRQLELRVPVMHSREQKVAEDFAKGISPYERAATLVLGRPVTKATDKPGYALGKMVMLAIQFRAQARKLQEASRADLGVDKPLPFWVDVIHKMFDERAPLITVQDEWIALAKKQGFLEAPLLGISRTFLGQIDRTYIPTIVNFPIQTLAALLILDAQITAEKWLRENGLRTRLVKNTYDEGSYDAPPEEVEIVKPKLVEIYRRPPLYDKLMEMGFYPIPLDVSVEVKYNDTTPTGEENAPTPAV